MHTSGMFLLLKGNIRQPYHKLTSQKIKNHLVYVFQLLQIEALWVDLLLGPLVGPQSLLIKTKGKESKKPEIYRDRRNTKGIVMGPNRMHDRC